MISISNDFKQLVKSGDTNYQNIVIITLADGTVLDDLTHEHILIGGIDKDNAVSEDTAFTALGAAIINSISVTIDNRDGTYSDYDFKGAKVTYRIRKLVNGTVENPLIGTYTVEDTRYNGFSIVLDCLDYMEKFDRPYVTGLNYPTSALNVVREACSRCGVLLNETRTGFPSLSDSITAKPDNDAVTYRDVISSIAQMHGYYAFIGVDGRLDFGWFDRSYLDTLIDRIDNNTFNPNDIDLTKVHYIESLFSQDISVDDVYITGIEITITEEVTSVNEESGLTSQQNVATTYSRGTDDYVISIEDNLFINSDNVEVIADRLASLLIGLRFRKCTITHLNDFTMEAGDIAVIKDRKGSYYPILVTRSNFRVGGRQTTVSGAETPSRNVSKIYSKYTKNIVRNNNLLNREKTQREVQYADLIERLANTNGLYMTADVDEGGASVYYLHNKPNKDESNIIWKMTSEAFAVSSDGGETWNAGLTVDGTLLVKILSAVGINADWINAGAITITDENGNVIFEVSKDENRVVIKDIAISIGDMNLPDKLDDIISSISWQADTKIETWYQPSTDDPSLTWDQKVSNLVDSNEDDILDHNDEPIQLLSDIYKRDHTGDLWHQTDTNEDYIYQNGVWVLSDIANTVYDLIGEKALIFTTTPEPPYDKGDLWFTGTDIKVCVQSKDDTEQFSDSDWEKKDYYTDYHNMTPYETWVQLTDNGRLQGIVRDQTTGQLYINGEYISANTIAGESIKAGTITTDRLAVANNANLYPYYDTLTQIPLDILTDSTSPNAVAGVDYDIPSISNPYSADYITPIYNTRLFRLIATNTSGSTNMYIFLGHSTTDEGMIPVQLNGKYRISFYARSGVDNVSLALWGRTYSIAKVQRSQNVIQAYTLTTSWVRYEADFTASDARYLRLGFAIRTANTYLDVCAIMVEKVDSFNQETSPFSPASVTMIDGGNIRSKSITSEQIKVVGGWTIEGNRMYAGNISLNAQGEKIDFTAYDNPNHNVERTTAFINNAGFGSFGSLASDSLIVGGEDIITGGSNPPAIWTDTTGTIFFKPVSLDGCDHINISDNSPFSGLLRLSSYAAGGTYALFVSANGTVQRSTTPASSSKRYKNHVRELTEEEGNLVYELNPVWYKYKDEYLPEDSEIRGQELTGFYAEDILQIIPNVVYYNKEGQVENWKERELIPYLVKTIQTQHKKITELENKIDEILTLLKERDI